MLNKSLYSSKKMDWETPQWLFDRLDDEFKFDIDVCANEYNHKCAKYFTKENDGLSMSNWGGYNCWMNPPYNEPEYPCKPKCKKKRCAARGHHIDEHIPGQIDWIKKAYEEIKNNYGVVVCLLPARTDTKYFHDYCMKASEIRFIKGRLKFVGAPSSAPFPSMIVIFKQHDYDRPLIRSMER